MMDMKNKYLREGEPQQAAEEPEVNVREGEIEPEVNVRDDAVEEEVNVREGEIEPEVNARDDAVEEEEVNVRESAVEPEINVREGVEEEEVNVREDAAEEEEEEEEVNMNRKKRGRKRKHQGQTNKSAKKLKNANENYFNYKGKLVNSKNFNYNIKCPCKLQCYKEIPRDLQENEFNNFWNLGDYTHQNMFLTKNVEEKESTVDENGNNKKGKKLFTRSYKIGNTPVCREMFRNVYQISTKRINTALTKLRNGNLQDLRGTLQGGQNKTSPDSVEKVKDHIKKLSQYKPHYKRGQKESKFLSPGMTLEKMYELYMEYLITVVHNHKMNDFLEKGVNEQRSFLKSLGCVSFGVYRNIFLNQFNLKFKSLKEDSSNKCDTYATTVGTETVATKEKIQQEYDKHPEMVTIARDMFKPGTLKAKENDHIECLTFDLDTRAVAPNLGAFNLEQWFPT